MKTINVEALDLAKALLIHYETAREWAKRINDLFNGNGKHTDQPHAILAAYDYHDERGQLLYQTVRYAPKDFKQRRPGPDRPGEWIWKTDGVRRVLYRLPEVLAAISDKRDVYVVEGEKDEFEPRIRHAKYSATQIQT